MRVSRKGIVMALAPTIIRFCVKIQKTCTIYGQHILYQEVRKFAYETEPVAQRTSFGNVISRIMDHPAWTRAKLAVVAKCLHVPLQPYFGLSALDDDDTQVTAFCIIHCSNSYRLVFGSVKTKTY